jgi:hypothetical protein
MIVDDFDGDGLTRPWSSFATATSAAATEFGSVMLTNVTGGFIEVVGEPFLDLRESRYSVTPAHRQGNPSVDDQFSLDLLTQDGKHQLVYGAIAKAGVGVEFELVAGYFERQEDGEFEFFSLGTKPYDPVAHAQLAIEHTGTVTRFLAADPGGELVEQFATAAAPLEWIGYMRPSFYSSAEMSMQYAFDTFNGGGMPVGEACPADVLREPFDQGVSDDWQRFEDNCAFNFDAGGDMRAEIGTQSGAAGCALQTSSYYNLRGKSVTIELKEVLFAAASNAGIALEIEGVTNRAYFHTRRHEAVCRCRCRW